jgi:hypothetical protein
MRQIPTEMTPPKLRELARGAGHEVLDIAAPGMDWGLNLREEHPRILALVREAIASAGEAGRRGYRQLSLRASIGAAYAG